jgi:hypothetical protein
MKEGQEKRKNEVRRRCFLRRLHSYTAQKIITPLNIDLLLMTWVGKEQLSGLFRILFNDALSGRNFK